MADKPTNDVSGDTDAQGKEQVDSPPADQTTDKPDQDARGGDTPRDGDSEEIKIPKSRLDEEVQRRRELEKKYEEVSKRSDEFENRFEKLATAIKGGDPEDKTPEEIRQISEKWNVPTGFVQEIIEQATEKSTSKVQKDIEPLKKSAAATSYEQEVKQLEQSVPDAQHMTSEERQKLKKLAHSPGYQKTPLKDIYKIVTYDNPRGSDTTAEPARGRSGRSSGAEDMMKKIEDMSPSEFKEFSNDLAKNG